MRMTPDQLDEIELVLSNESGFYKQFVGPGYNRKNVLFTWVDKFKHGLREPFSKWVEEPDAAELLARFEARYAEELGAKPDQRTPVDKPPQMLPLIYPEERVVKASVKHLLGTDSPLPSGPCLQGGSVIRTMHRVDGTLVAECSGDLSAKVYHELNKTFKDLDNATFWRRLAYTLLVFHEGKMEWAPEAKSDPDNAKEPEQPLVPLKFPSEREVRAELHHLLGTTGPNANFVVQSSSEGKAFLRNRTSVTVATCPRELYQRVFRDLNSNLSSSNGEFWIKLMWTLLVYHRDKLEWVQEPDAITSFYADKRKPQLTPTGEKLAREAANFRVQAENANAAATKMLEDYHNAYEGTVTGRMVCHTPIPFLEFPKSRLASQKETIFATSPALGKQPESTMTKVITITTITTESTDAKDNKVQTLVNGSDIKNLTTAQVYGLISDAEELIETLSKIKSKPLQLQAEIEAHKVGVAALVKHLDERYLAENPGAAVPVKASRKVPNKVTQAAMREGREQVAATEKARDDVAKRADQGGSATTGNPGAAE